ncbi:MAG TPA: SUMF1/EgtB/PvdO family nonheme iron enzyme, partial [Thermoanaerobaculia bacterium]|nr:SUMF1/EgtB/PvdO family nonheme iron enzyme [Thermoanaerobaculia bacterium]
MWEPLRPYHHYRADTAEGYEDLYRRLTDQPALVRPKLGTRKVLPPRNLPAQQAQSAAPGPASATNPAPPAAPAQAKPPQPTPGQPWTEPTTDIRFLWVPPGEFSMGSNEIGDHERPAHRVKLSGFWLAETPVTNRQYGLYLGGGQGKVKEPYSWHVRRFSSPKQPVVQVGWEEAQAYCQWLSGLASQPVNLPSEAQWEYAARGSQGRKYPWGDKPEPNPQLACFAQNLETGSPAVVGSYPAGAGPFGHLDLAGTVWEWCLDVWDAEAYKGRKGMTENPVVKGGGSRTHVVRGGGWRNSADGLQSAFRSKSDNWLGDALIGFRVAISP